MVQVSNPCTEKPVKYQIMMHGIRFTLKIVVVVIVIFVMTFMQVICNYILETNNVSSVYSIAAVPYLQSVLHLM
jgi:hypothetical protein